VTTATTERRSRRKPGGPDSVGKKILMAVTGVVLLGFVIGHMIGNLKVYQGAAAFNQYAEGLRGFGAPLLGQGQALWGVRLILLLAVLTHIWAAVSLTLQSRAARTIQYRKFESLAFSYASRTMVWGGFIILVFVVYHILHLTLGTVHPDFVEHDAYYNFVAGFSVWPVSVFYILAMFPLGLHIYHGTWSALQSLGANNPRYNAYRRPAALGIAILVVLGNISFPLAVLFGIVG
jgi:succinate dehydrogenase / fumarate reductase, cytochrome b subunit